MSILMDIKKHILVVTEEQLKKYTIQTITIQNVIQIRIFIR